ncbi:hypothetical protein SODALDRAFT_42452 [Sodiomyces alkalinus F11]|uniref:Uncharacterized protein n=1 Tax=Sodiomyces alkalinus (strain CBS 110278 / VKM F-3762 / F11) TaxID=1314773 RepID=A0A3N2QA10_SODAK|nr:hypothetical protein SODALDRAFT_42452 [Sodiomyces alkalinus F11]ROT43576.1 hypothetical protein SODALDRAFT_42452 [Sodiomyces alkalinus F11]
MEPSKKEVKQSWWKRHCTPPPAINKSPMCPCRECFDAAPQIYDDVTPSESPAHSTPSPSAFPSAASSRKNSVQLLQQGDGKDAVHQGVSTSASLAHVETVKERKRKSIEKS